VVVIPEEAIPPAAVVDAAKAARAEAAVDAVKADPVGRVAVQVGLAAASASISARRKFASFASRRWT
jgi:hypothetical protein